MLIKIIRNNISHHNKIYLLLIQIDNQYFIQSIKKIEALNNSEPRTMSHWSCNYHNPT